MVTVNPMNGTATPDNISVVVNPDGTALGSAASPFTTQTSTLQTTADLTKTIFAITTATTTTLITATAATKGRAYRVRIDLAGANVVTITDATGGEEMNFAAAGFKILDVATRAWYVTATNTALTVTTTTTAKCNITVEFTKVA